MHLDWSTLALQTVNVLILCWLLYRFLYRPILGVMDARRSLIEGQIADAEAARKKAADDLATVTAMRADMAGERDALLATAAAEAQGQAQARLDEAQRQAAVILEEGRKSLAAERQRALAQAKEATLDLAVAVAARLLAASPPSLRATAWIELIERHLAALPAGERQALLRQFDGKSRLKVVTAAALPADDETAWRSRLAAALGAPIPTDFAVDETLLGGAELFFPGAILRFSWKDALATLRSELEKEDAAG